MTTTKTNTIGKKATSTKTVKINTKVIKKSPFKKSSPKTVGVKNERFCVEELSDFIVKSLDDGKALDILKIDLKGKTSLADFLIIASGTSTRQVIALASTLSEKTKDLGFTPKMDGRQGSGEWVILDYGDIIVHIFYPQTRAFYEIEKLWGVSTPAV